jgi:hypothetical protein
VDNLLSPIPKNNNGVERAMPDNNPPLNVSRDTQVERVTNITNLQQTLAMDQQPAAPPTLHILRNVPNAVDCNP